MAKTATKPVKSIADVQQRDASHSSEPRSFRWTFAQSICKANYTGNLKEQSACKTGIPCTKLAQCSKLADNTIKYLEQRKSYLPAKD